MIYRVLIKCCAQKQQLNPTVLLSKIWYWISFLDPYIFFLCFFGIKKHFWNTQIIPRLNPSTYQRIGTFKAKEDNSFQPIWSFLASNLWENDGIICISYCRQKRGIDFGLGRGYSGSKAARHMMGMYQANYAGGPGKK